MCPTLLLRVVLSLVAAWSLIAGSASAAPPVVGVGAANRVLILDGDSAYVELPAAVFTGLREATLEAWVRWDEWTYFSQLFAFGTPGDYGRAIGINHYYTSPILQAFAYQDVPPGLEPETFDLHVLRVESDLPLGQWCHMAATFGRGGMRFYLNGVLLGEHGFTGSFADHGPGAVAYLGRSTWQANHLFHGAIDEVRLWSQARSPEEIRAGMARPADPREPGLVGLWGFDAGDARDASPRAHHGELRGAARVEAAAFPGDASPQLPAVVRGTVSDEAGEPVINTGVRLTAAAGRWIDTSSGEFGMFSVAVLDTGRFTVNVLEGNVRIASRQVVLVPGEIVDLDLRPSPPSLVARWSFEGDVRDHVGGHDGQRLGEIVTVPGVVGAALAFADSQDIVRVPVAPSLNPEGSFSIIAWIHPTARPDTPMGIVGLWGDTDPWESQRAYRLALEPGSRLWFAVSDDSHQGDASFHNFLTRPNSLPAHAWTMVTAVWDGAAGERSVYVNGVLARRRANAAGPISRSEADLSIGGLRPSPIRAFLPFSGHMDEVSFYDVALAEEEIGRLYSAHARALWSAEGNAKDVSRSGHDGVLIGGVGFTDGVRGQAFDLTEAGGYVEFDPRIGNYGTADFSLELWLRRETTPAQPSAILVKGAAALHDDAEAAVAAAAGDEYRAPRDALVLSLMAEGSLSVLIAGRREAVRMHGTIALSEGAWHHVALVREGSSARLFVDGELDTSAETARPIELRTPEPLLLGGLPRGASFPGQIDEIALHGAPLSSTAISTTHGRVLAEWRWRTWRSRLQTWGSMALGLLVVVTGSRYVAQRRERRRELLRLTEAERARQAADEANEAKSAFLANMSHEIRTPMNAIMGHAQMLRDDQALGDEQRRRSADTICAQGDLLLDLVDDILDLSKAEAGRMQLQTVDFDLGQLIDSLRVLFEMRCRQKGLRLCVELEGEAAVVRGDEAKLRQTLGNLLGNAVKFTDQGVVTLQVTLEDSGCRFEVGDTGPGIPPEQQIAMFEPFQQGASGLARGGTGLGLAIANRHVTLMGGRLELDSAPGEGARFAFRLPLILVSERRTTAGRADRSSSEPRLNLDPKLRQRLLAAVEMHNMTEIKRCLADLRKLGDREAQFADTLTAGVQRFDLASVLAALQADDDTHTT